MITLQEHSLFQSNEHSAWYQLPDTEIPFAENWQEACRQCRHCRLCQEGNRGPTTCTGEESSPLFIVGEGPGGVEDEYGVPLVGPSGQLLDKALASVGITRDRVYVTNIVKCRPRGNRTPALAEGATCANRWLVREIVHLRPAVILTLGKVALQFFLGRESGIVRERGKWFTWQSPTGEMYPVMPTFHPAYLLRLTGKSEVEAKWQVYYDLQAAKEKAAEVQPDYRWWTDPPQDIRLRYREERAARIAAHGR